MCAQPLMGHTSIAIVATVLDKDQSVMVRDGNNISIYCGHISMSVAFHR